MRTIARTLPAIDSYKNPMMEPSEVLGNAKGAGSRVDTLFGGPSAWADLSLRALLNSRIPGYI